MRISIITIIIASVITSCASAQVTEMVNGRKFILHTVQKKETLYGISRKYDVPQDTIAAYNNGVAYGIRVDQVLRFPSKEALQVSGPVTSPNLKDYSERIAHVVKPGETLYSISKRYNTTVEAIVALNPGSGENLKAESVLLIPVRPGTQPQTTVKEPDAPVTGTVVSAMKKEQCGQLPLRTDKKFNVALLLPFNSSGGINSKIAVEFYGGVKIALDSILKDGMNIKLHVYDTRSKNDSDQVTDLLRKPELKTMDLIIGPLYTANLKPVAEFAQENRIPLVSPFSRLTTILEGYPYVIKATPSEETVAKRVLSYTRTFYGNANIILVDPGTRKDSLLHDYYQREMRLMGGTDTINFHYTKLRTGGMYGKLKSGKKNIVIFPCSKEITVKDFLTKFNKSLKDQDISLIGTEEWLDFSNVEADYYENLNLHVPAVNFANYTDTANYSFIGAYQKAFKSDPSAYAFKGYHVASYMIRALFRYDDKTCECLPVPVDCRCNTPFRFREPVPGNGFENEMIQMIIFKNYAYRTFPY